LIAALARPSLARLLRTPRPLLALGAWSVLALGFALAARARGAAHGADHVLVEAFGALVLPLLAYTLVGAVLGARSLSAATAPLVLFGAPATRAAATTAGVGVIACVTVGATMAAVVALVAHGLSDPPAVGDAAASAFAGAMGGGGYAAWFLVGASFGRRGGGRTALLVADWVLGLGRGRVALFTPRAHLRNLLGGTPPMDWSGRASAAALLVMIALCLFVAIRRTATASRR
jgi:hypothetical protein